MNVVPGRVLKYIIITLILQSAQFLYAQSMFHGDSLHTGYYATKELQQTPNIKWQFKTNGKVFSSPVLWNQTIYIGSDDSCLYAIDAPSGNLRWKFGTCGAIKSTPAISNGVVFVGSYDGNFYALDAATGQQRWTFATRGEHHFCTYGINGHTPSTMLMDDYYDFLCSSPVIYKQDVYFGCGDSTFYALDAQRGTLDWSYKTGGVIHSSPAASDGKIIFGSWDRYLYCLDAQTGKEIWKYATGYDPNKTMTGITASPTIAHSTVYIGTRDSYFYALDLSTGSKKWSVGNNGSWVQASAAIKDSIVYYGTSDNTVVQALNAYTGASRFSINTFTYEYSSPAITENVIYFGNFSGYMRAYNRITSQELWSFQTKASKQNSAAILTGGQIDWARLYAGIDPKPYSSIVSVMNKILTLGSIVSSPLVDDGVVYFGSADSCVYALAASAENGVNQSQGNNLPPGLPFEIYPNYPNPFNPTTHIYFSVWARSHVQIDVTDVLGRQIATVLDDWKPRGSYQIAFSGENLTSGIYYLRMRVGRYTQTQKMVLEK